MVARRRGSARVPLQRIERLFAHRRELEQRIQRVDAIIETLLLRLRHRHIHTVDVARRLARVIGEPMTILSLARLDARLRQRRARARRKRATSETAASKNGRS